MKFPLPSSKRLILGVALAVSALAFSTAAVPAAHAGSPPTITAYGLYETVRVTGSNFTPDGTVYISVYDSHWNFLNSVYVSASPPVVYCIKGQCHFLPGGTINAWLSTAPYFGYVHVHAQDEAAGYSGWSNWSTTYVYMLP